MLYFFLTKSDCYSKEVHYGYSENQNDIANSNTALGIEFGSTRIKAVLVNSDNVPIATGSHTWENRLENGIRT